ncbi:MAG: aconitate hydratase, partial [Candidatus Omnitrophica bacterium]|nr:aconitate hydratase [Candidatus Omnitrophota bacterium]
HTPTCGGLGMLAIGAGGLDVVVAMAGKPFYLKMPKIVKVELKGKLKPWVTAKDIVFEVLRRYTVKGGVGKIFEYAGDGVKHLTVPERATITNMGAELGATTSIFPSDENTREYLSAQKRENSWQELLPDPDAKYDEECVIKLSSLEPSIACPHSPDNIKRVSEVAGAKIDQVAIGSCTNSSYEDLTAAAKMLKGKKVHPGVSLVVTPGSRQVYEIIAGTGALFDLIQSGARILELACGPCIGMGQAPPSGGVSLRSFNRNFPGRSGTEDANVYLASTQVCAASALTGRITDPRELGKPFRIKHLKEFIIDDALILPPSESPDKIEILRGPNIVPCPTRGQLGDELKGEVLLKVGDNISTDHILPAGPKILPLRSNIPKISEFVFVRVDPQFPKRAKEKGGGFVVGGENYGQGSSREHAALAPMYLGLKAVIAKSFARIHKDNLVNFGIVPLVFANAGDYETIEQGEQLSIAGLKAVLQSDGNNLTVSNLAKGKEITVILELTLRQRQLLLAGGLLNYLRLPV